MVEHHARLNHNALGGDRNDPTEMATEVDDQSRAQDTARRVGPGPACLHGDLVLRGVSDRGRHILLGPGDDHPEGVDLINAGIMRVTRAFEWLE